MMGNTGEKAVTTQELTEICLRKHYFRSTPKMLFKSSRKGASDFDEVFPNLFISSMDLAMDRVALDSLGMTHVLNCAEGTSFMHVDTGASFYAGMEISYLGLKAHDSLSYKLSKHFEEAADFIDDALKAGGKVLVHCVQGYSRSPTICVAYLMIKKEMSARKAMERIRTRRTVFPNEGFLRLLVGLEEKLRIQRKAVVLNPAPIASSVPDEPPTEKPELQVPSPEAEDRDDCVEKDVPMPNIY